MKIERVLVVFRKSLYQLYVRDHNERSVRQALRRGDTIALSLRQSHVAMAAALASIRRTLDSLGIEFVCRWRAHMRSTRRFDLVISLGGDGTLLDTSHRILDETPLLGINSDPSRSVGALCSGTASDLPLILESLSAGRLRPERVTRIRLRVEGQEVLGPTLNDVLLSHCCPAGLSRFDLAILPAAEALAGRSGYDGEAFAHVRGSGLWVSTATGSTAAIHSAGGRVLPPSSRRLQYLIREPYMIPGSPSETPCRGLLRPEETLVLISRIRQGAIWADGAHRSQTLGYSQQVLLDRHPVDLHLVRRPR